MVGVRDLKGERCDTCGDESLAGTPALALHMQHAEEARAEYQVDRLRAEAGDGAEERLFSLDMQKVRNQSYEMSYSSRVSCPPP